MAGILELLIVVVVLVLLGVGVVAAVLRFRSSGKGSASELPSCGRCGYAVRGISSLVCPECGADLTIVGITKGNKRNTVIAGCLIPIAFSLIVYLLAILLFALLESAVVPTYSSDDYSLSFLPASEQYDWIDFEVDATSIIPADQNMTTAGFSVDTINRFTAPRTNISLYDPGTTVRVHELRLIVEPASGPAPSRKVLFFEVDPKTRQATWVDDRGKPKSSKGALSEKDVLAFLGDAGADTTRPDVISEAQQLHVMIGEFLEGTYEFTLEGFKSSGYSTGSSGSTGPPWFLPAYAAAWLALWIVGLIWLARRAVKMSRSASNQA